MGVLDRTQFGYWQKSVLNYKIYAILAVFLGFFAIDHLYLRSPITFLLKLIINIATFGFLWFYDATNALFNKDEISLFGVNFPLANPVGVGAGMFLNIPESMNVEDREKSSNFLIYALVLFATGLFGGDSFLVGDRMSGFIRLISCISIIGLPLAGIWVIYKLFEFFFQTHVLLDSNWGYFGAPKPSDTSSMCPNVLQQFTVYAVETAGVFIGMLPFVDRIPFIKDIIPMIQDTVIALKQAYGMTVEAINTVVTTAKAVADAGPALAAAATATSQIDPAKFANAVAKERGTVISGGSISFDSGSTDTTILSAGIICVVLLIIISGCITVIRRSMTINKNKNGNGNINTDDIPPQPLISKH